MILIGAYSTLCSIAPVDMWWHKLVCDIVVLENILHFLSTFIIQYVDATGLAMGFE